MRIANLATIAVFALFLAAPVGSLALLGLYPAAEKVVTLEELATSKLVAPDDHYRDDVARRLVTNSLVGMNAIRAKNSLDFNVFGFVNTSDVISGEDGWLFYKPGFANGGCLPDRSIGVALGRTEAMRAIASAIGIDYRLSVSPDKEVVYPEKLGPAAEAAAGCKIVSSRKWRQIAAASGSSIIDHLEAMDHDVVDDLLYFKTDTHWNELGKVKAFRQLVRELVGREVPADIVSNTSEMYAADIPKALLRISHEEEKKLFTEYLDRNFPSDSQYKIPDAIVIHDSFYGVSRELLHRIFLNPAQLTYGMPEIGQRFRDLMAKNPKLVLANTVERSLMQRVGGDLSWTGAVGKGFLEANSSVARTCPVGEVADTHLTLKNLERRGARDFNAGIDPQIYVKLADHGRPCIRISFETPVKQQSFIFLPIRDAVNQNGPYFEGFSIPLADTPGAREFWLLLPEEFAGTTLRMDPIGANGAVTNLSIQSGFLPPIERISAR